MKQAIAALATTTALSISFSETGIEFEPYGIIWPVVLVLLFLVYSQICDLREERDYKENAAHIILSVMLSIFMVVGSCFEATDDFSLLSGTKNIILALIYILGFVVLFYYLVMLLFIFLDTKGSCIFSESQDDSPNAYIKLLTSHTFATVFITLFICFIPYLIVSFPAISLSDEYLSLLQYYDPDTPFSNYNPILYTLLFNVVVHLGKTVFGTTNAAFFLYSFSQMICALLAVSYGCSYLLRKLHVKPIAIIVAELYFVITPRFHNYLMVMTKDVPYASSLVVFLCSYHAIVADIDRSKKNYVICILSAAGLFFSRNEGRYVLLFAFVMAILFCGKRFIKRSAIGIVSVLLVSIVLGSVIFPLCGVQPGNKREMFSIPFQQTARYIRDKGDNVTEEEKAAISAILDYKKIGKKYNPYRSDNVKNTFKKDATNTELRNYFKTWFAMFKKEPLLYCEATINNYYQYVYPGKVLMDRREYGYSEEVFSLLNKDFGKYGLDDLHYPGSLDKYRNLYQSFYEKIEKIPVVSLFVSAATYGWAILIMLFYSIYRRNKSALAINFVPLGILLMCFVGPCNGFYCRYTYPLIFTIPFIIIITLYTTEFVVDEPENFNKGA